MATSEPVLPSASHQVTIDAEATETAGHLGYARGFELTQVRAQCRHLEMEKCYNRYLERLIVTNVALYLFIMEFLLGIHILILAFLSESSFWISTPYLALMILLPMILYICFMDKTKFENFRVWNIVASWVAALLVTMMDAFVTLLVEPGKSVSLSCYEHINIISIYFFLPVNFYGSPYWLGLVVSLLYFVYELYYSEEDHNNLKTPALGNFALYLFALNVMSMVFRIAMEYRLRQKVICRRQLLHQNFLLKSVMQKEKDMIQTILPQEIAHSLQQEIRTRIEEQRLGKQHLTPRTLFVELHSDVSILVADMVNYTYLTTQLDCKTLVKILHELFVKYDMAAEQNNVLRIKFLGDAYNCVSGIPHYNRQHAKNCVALALEMINETAITGKKHALNIGMRIGVHSGEVFSGIIGRTKWQYDIWSRDVDIAYRLENWGKPGMVHISKATLSLLDNEYPYEESSELVKNDRILQKAHINTFLIAPSKSYQSKIVFTSGTTNSSASNMSYSEEPDNYVETQNKTQSGMIDKVERMPVGRIQLARVFDFSHHDEAGDEDYLFKPHISSFWRLFRNSDVEWTYMNEPDILMKYSLLMVVFVGIIIFVENRIPPFTKHFPQVFVLLIFVIIICLMAFYKKIWIELATLSPWSKPKFFLSRWLFSFSEMIEEQLIVRIFVSFSGIFFVYIMATLNSVECNPQEFQLDIIQADLTSRRIELMCFEPWGITQNVIMVLTLLFFFAGLPLVFKAGLGVFIVASYILTVHTFFFVWQRGETTNRGLPAEYAALWYLLAFWLLLLLLEQHLTYINKVDYHSKLLYEEKLRQTENGTHSIKIILANILPIHVANSFLDRGQSNTLFYENYSKVAVMFASIENFEPDKTGLSVLNEYICCFDDLLASYLGNFKVEKIKVIGWTYMAACGLLAENLTELSTKVLKSRKRTSSPILRRTNAVQFKPRTEDECPRHSSFRARFTHPLLQKDDNCVLTMMHFALDMLHIMSDITQQNVYLDFGGSMRGQLKIGISHGPVMAGVVGFSRPHYDIWGHTVNMASRMASTGVKGNIQVTENTAVLLRNFDIKCDYRGKTEVKGIGEIPTYFLALDESLNFQHIDEKDLDAIEFVESDSKPRISKVVFLETSQTDIDEDTRENEKGTQTKRNLEKNTDT